MSPDDPRHGTYAGVKAHNKSKVPCCRPCADARYLYQKRMRVRLANGDRRRVELGQEAHQVLAECGVTAVAAHTGLARNSLYGVLADGPNARVLLSTRTAILSARPTWTTIGLRRRLQALAMLGWSCRMIADRFDIGYTCLKRVTYADELVYVKYEQARIIVDLYEDLHMRAPTETTPGVKRVRQIAASRGFVAPLAWDDIDHDAAPAAPVAEVGGVDDLAVQRAFDGDTTVHLNNAERRAFVARWLSAGRSYKALQDDYGYKVDRYTERAA